MLWSTLCIIYGMCSLFACIVAVSNKLTHYDSTDNKHFTNCFISHVPIQSIKVTFLQLLSRVEHSV